MTSYATRKKPEIHACSIWDIINVDFLTIFYFILQLFYFKAVFNTAKTNLLLQYSQVLMLEAMFYRGVFVEIKAFESTQLVFYVYNNNILVFIFVVDIPTRMNIFKCFTNSLLNNYYAYEKLK